MRIATWNIGGGILGESHQLDGTSDLDYYASMIQGHSPDVVCLQEAHSYEDRPGQTATLSAKCGYRHWLEFPISPSHLQSDAYLSLGILSKSPISNAIFTPYPNPNLSAKGPNGEDWVLFDKGHVTFELEAESLLLMNAHCYPLHYFGVSAEDPRFEALWDAVTDPLTQNSHRRYVAAIDLNSPRIDTLLAKALQQGYHEGFKRAATTAKGQQQDFILLSASVSRVSSSVIATESDHHLCLVDIG